MATFIVSKPQQRPVTGQYEVHNLSRGCSLLSVEVFRQPLGEFLICHSALEFVRRQNGPSLIFNGCAYCCNECHTT